eukprot:594566-Pleurochrysis_carterae.AAC.5
MDTPQADRRFTKGSESFFEKLVPSYQAQLIILVRTFVKINQFFAKDPAISPLTFRSLSACEDQGWRSTARIHTRLRVIDQGREARSAAN